MSWIAIILALVLVKRAFRCVRSGFYPAMLSLVCGVVYVLLSLEWITSLQPEVIGRTRDLAWSMVEIGFILGLIGQLGELDRRRRDP